ncbi:hypothetical protein PV721_26685 [Streptomyces sp. MB09-01]|uniref:hypothetical protein n=1 Tax=Streptomyces sp. MB09-01 TaxID=3028666 RepID=UPI0029BF5863|nr:hypothetical protein [Streptomyces sp. MB09-01]MDX3537880.1 hypothetical protein [Streptomyces sp. MB09-01]
MGEKSKVGSDAPVSVRISLKGPAAVPALVAKLQDNFAEVADSVALSVRGSKSVVVDLLSELGDRAGDVSAEISLKGDTPAKQ